ncbi:glycosyl hydrolase family 3, partial [Oceanobacter sp. 2_MG-2023]|nr:glycosyl hydrolase family 3 [Oceanobacter sp. 2_MG-2023]
MVPYDWKKLYGNLISQVQSGEIAQSRLDDAVRRILRVKIRANLWAAKPSERINLATIDEVVGHASHREVA